MNLHELCEVFTAIGTVGAVLIALYPNIFGPKASLVVEKEHSEPRSLGEVIIKGREENKNKWDILLVQISNVGRAADTRSLLIQNLYLEIREGKNKRVVPIDYCYIDKAFNQNISMSYPHKMEVGTILSLYLPWGSGISIKRYWEYIKPECHVFVVMELIGERPIKKAIPQNWVREICAG